MSDRNRVLRKVKAAWDLIEEDVAGLWMESPDLGEEDRMLALKLADALEHFAMRLHELGGGSETHGDLALSSHSCTLIQ